MKSKKAIAEHFLQLASKGDSREAFKLYGGENFKHHNVYFKGDAQTLMDAMEEAAKHSPNKIFDIQRSLQDKNLVAVHSRVRPNPESLGFAVIHIFRFEGQKVVELWDFGQEVPNDMVNENGMF